MKYIILFLFFITCTLAVNQPECFTNNTNIDCFLADEGYDWFASGSWSLNRIPTVNDTVIIRYTSCYMYHDTDNATVDNLYVSNYDNRDIVFGLNGKLTVNSKFDNTGHLIIKNTLILKSNDTFYSNNTINVNNGSIINNGVLIIHNNSVINIHEDCTITNLYVHNSHITLRPHATLTLDNFHLVNSTLTVFSTTSMISTNNTKIENSNLIVKLYGKMNSATILINAKNMEGDFTYNAFSHRYFGMTNISNNNIILSVYYKTYVLFAILMTIIGILLIASIVLMAVHYNNRANHRYIQIIN